MKWKYASPEEDVREELAAHDIQTVRITQIIKMDKSTRTVITKYPIFVITFQPGTDMRKVLQLHKLCHCIIWWEKFKNSRPVRQCFNWQSFGHSSKLLIRPVLTYAAPVWSNTSSSNYRHLQLLQSKCLRVIGNYPRRTPISHLHSALNLEPIHEFIYRLTGKFFNNRSTHPNPLVRQIGNYTLPYLHKQYRKYIHKRTKHLLL